MTERKKVKRIFFILLIATAFSFFYQLLNLILSADYLGSPSQFSVYPISGYYEIDPDTIHDKLELEESNVLVTTSSEIWFRDEPSFKNTCWTKSEFLNVANEISIKKWQEPIDLDEWKILYLNLSNACDNSPKGFSSFRIVYYQFTGIFNWEKQYTSRYIEIIPWQGLARWGMGKTFSSPLLIPVTISLKF